MSLIDPTPRRTAARRERPKRSRISADPADTYTVSEQSPDNRLYLRRCAELLTERDNARPRAHAHNVDYGVAIADGIGSRDL
jgi:hypothetical protein